MVRCPACSGDAPDGGRFCPWCGATLDTESASSATVTPTSAPTATGSDETPTVGAPRSPDRRGLSAGMVVADRYRIVQLVGRGGMGEVWLAEQEAPVRRKVAFKVIKLGMDTRQVVTRFEAERQALAMMDHPAVAKVFDAGSTPGGRPFFVMEYVTGSPMTHFCDESRLTTRQRLELFQHVCGGVQHAHQKALIHRDLKPSNVLVSLQDGEPAPKIIDFGIAKATGQQLTEETMHTQMGVIIGTPEYMSPEQARGQHVDTRSDVYSLGVMLYELLVGKRPFESKGLREDGYDSIRRKICNEDPPRPSTRFHALGDARSDSATNRHTDPSTLQRELKGDLDWITMKAMEKEPARRYVSPAELAADIESYLGHRPVTARPPSMGYRAGKFIRRHRWGVALVFSLAVALIAGMIGTAVAVQEAMDASSQTVAQSFEGEPELEMEVRSTMALVYHELGEYAQAEDHLRRAVELAEREAGPRAAFTVGVRGKLARTLMDAGRYDDAEREMRALLPIFREERGDDDKETLALMGNLAAVYLHQERYDQAEPLLLEVVEVRREALGADHMDTQSASNNLAQLYMFTERYQEAEPLLRETLIVRRRELEDRHPRTLISVFNLGDLYHRMGQDARAEGLMREALEGFRAVVGESHPYTLETLGALVQVLVQLDRLAEAEILALESHRLRAERFRADHDLTAQAADVLVEIYEKTGRPEEAARFRR
jgi:non-specific serine/threonine protein kinase/serine/threonine-protein kinase